MGLKLINSYANVVCVLCPFTSISSMNLKGRVHEFLDGDTLCGDARSHNKIVLELFCGDKYMHLRNEGCVRGFL